MLDKNELKEFIVNVINDDDISLEDIEDDTVLVGKDGIFFDSVDVLELIVELDNKYKIKIQDNDLITEKLKTFQTFFGFVQENIKN